MNACDQEAALLRADVAELNGTASTSLGEHIRDCDRCRARARTILARYEALGEVLDAPVVVDAKGIVAAGRHRSDTGVRKSPWRLPMPPMWAAAAAAASIAAALVLSLPVQQEPPPGEAWLPAPAPSVPVVSAPHHNVAVIQTDNPDITVFWFYKE